MKKYQYQIIRYIHDRITGEFVNVGLILFLPDTNFLHSKFVNKFSRISNFFNEINGYSLLSSLKQFEKEVEIISKRIDSNDLFEKFISLNEITNSILIKDDSAIDCSEVKFGIDIDGKIAIDDLFERLVDRYNQDYDKDSHDDKFIWRTFYKKHFDKKGITSKLKEHTVQTNNDKIHFDKAWKNGIWNCFQAISFDLKRTDSIKNKVYKWSGILKELENSKENVHLYFLTESLPNKRSLHNFIEETLNKKSAKIKAEIVTKKQAETFTSSLKEEIDAHEIRN